MRRNNLPTELSSADVAKWKENYNNIQRVSQQQKHELSMLKIEAQSYQRRNESLLKQINILKQNEQQNQKHKAIPSSTTATTATHETGVTSPRSTNIEQKQSRKIANLEYELKFLKDENVKLKNEIDHQRKENIVYHSKIHVLEHHNKELENKNKENNDVSNNNDTEQQKKIVLYNIKKQIESSMQVFDSMKYRSILTDGMKQNISEILKDTNTLCNRIESGFYVPLSEQLETAQNTMAKLKYNLSNLKSRNKELSETNSDLLSENTKTKKHVESLSKEIAKLRARRGAVNQKQMDENNRLQQKIEKLNRKLSEYERLMPKQIATEKELIKTTANVDLLRKELKQLNTDHNEKIHILKSVANVYGIKQDTDKWTNVIMEAVKDIKNANAQLKNEVTELNKDRNELQLQLIEVEENQVNISAKNDEIEEIKCEAIESKNELLNNLQIIKDDYCKLQSEYDDLSNTFDEIFNILCVLSQRFGVVSSDHNALELAKCIETKCNEMIKENENLKVNERERSVSMEINFESEIKKLRDKLKSKSALIKEMEGHLSSAHQMTLKCDSLTVRIEKLKQETNFTKTENVQLKQQVESFQTNHQDIELLQAENKILKINLDDADLTVIENKTLKEANDHLDKQITEYHAENERLHHKIQQTEAEKEDMDKRAKIIDDMSQLLQDKINVLSQSANDWLSDITITKDHQHNDTELQSMIDAKNTEIEELKTNIDRLSNEYQHMVDENHILEDQLKELKTMNTEIPFSEEKEIQYQASINRLSEDIERKKNMLMEMKHQLDEDSKTFVAEYKELHIKYQDLQKHFDEKQNIIKTKEANLKDLQIKYEDIVHDIEDINANLEHTTTRNHQLEQEILSQQKYIESQSQKQSLLTNQKHKLRQIYRNIIDSKHDINNMKQELNFQPIFNLFGTFSTSFNDLISQHLNRKGKLETKVTDLQQQLTRFKMMDKARDTIKKPSNTTSVFKAVESKQNRPKKIKHTMMKTFIEIQKESQSDTSTLDSMRNKLIAIKSDVNHTSHRIIKTISTPNRESLDVKSKKRNRIQRSNEATSSDIEQYNDFVKTFRDTTEKDTKPCRSPIDVARDTIYGYNTSELLEWIKQQKKSKSVGFLYKYMNNIKNRRINGKKLLSFTPFSMECLGVVPTDIPLFMKCISNINSNVTFSESVSSRTQSAHGESVSKIDSDNVEILYQTQSEEFQRSLDEYIENVRNERKNVVDELEMDVMKRVSVADRIAQLKKNIEKQTEQHPFFKSPPKKKRKKRKQSIESRKCYSSLTDLPPPSRESLDKLQNE